MAHSTPNSHHPDTLAVLAGRAAGEAGRPFAVPLDPSAGYSTPPGDDPASHFNGEASGPVDWSRSHPVVALLEERVAALDGGIGAVACASAPAALLLAIATASARGGHVVAASNVGGDRRELLAFALPRLGIETTFVEARDPDAWREAIRPETVLLVADALADPSLDVLDIPAIGDISRRARVPLLVDASLVTPALARPLAHGAHLVLHSATGYLAGHGTVAGAVLVDGGRFDWAASGRHAALSSTNVDECDAPWTDESAVAAFLLRAKRITRPRLGLALAPQAAHDAVRGLETLALRMARHASNARALADFLAGEASVARVRHPSHPGDPDHDLATRLMAGSGGGLVAFDIERGFDGARRFLATLSVIGHGHLAGAPRSLALHPAGSTFSHLDDEARRALGAGPGTIRLSAGLEHPADLVDDVARALKAASR